MGKRDAVVVLSSDDEGDGGSLSLNRSYVKPKPKSVVTRSEAGRAKKPRISGSRSRSRGQFGAVDEFQFFDEDFNQVFTGVKSSFPSPAWDRMRHPSASSRRSSTEESWVDKYKPCTLEELAVHKKKVDEVKSWFEEKLFTSEDDFRNRVLVITGPAGVGKSATIHVIASHLGATLCEWSTPTPTLWKEYLHSNSNTGEYVSKLDEFETFVEKMRKYGLISQSSAKESKSPAALVIDDLPVTYGKVACRRLLNCLLLLVQHTHMPTAILLTDCGQANSAEKEVRYLDDLPLSLESAGAHKIAFNPITNNSIKRTLSRICKQEQCDVTAEQIDLIAKASGGDIRHAITSIQFLCLKAHGVPSLPLSNSTWVPELHFGRDETISLFHALGKFLHNKREPISSKKNAHSMHEKFMRLPLKMDAPEKVLSQVHGQSRPIADFLHENVLDFLNEEAVDDASSILTYLGDADVLLQSFHRMLARNYEAEGVVQSAAASIAVRGVLFGNSHPLPPRWHAIRKPKLWQIEKSSLYYKVELLRQRFTICNGVSLSNMTVLTTEYMPVYKRLEQTTRGGVPAQVLMLSGEIEGGMRLDDEAVDFTDDEIEEW